MTKLEKAAALLPLVIKAHKKKHEIDLDIAKDVLAIWHWRYTEKRVHIKITNKRTFDKAIAYLTNLTK